MQGEGEAGRKDVLENDRDVFFGEKKNGIIMIKTNRPLGTLRKKARRGPLKIALLIFSNIGFWSIIFFPLYFFTLKKHFGSTF